MSGARSAATPVAGRALRGASGDRAERGRGRRPSDVPAGVMSADYAAARRRKAPLIVRLRIRADVVVRAIRRHLPPGPVRLLDVGAAEGATLLTIARRLGDGTYVGVEYDEGLCAAAPPPPVNVRLIAGDALDLPPELADGAFDAVCMLALLEHVVDPLRALREARRVLRDDGVLVCTCPNPRWDRLAGRLGMVADEHHVEAIDLRRLRVLVTKAGFEVLAARAFMWAPIAVLPYAGIPVGPWWMHVVDAVLGRWWPSSALCVNGAVVARARRCAPPPVPSVSDPATAGPSRFRVSSSREPARVDARGSAPALDRLRPFVQPEGDPR